MKPGANSTTALIVDTVFLELFAWHQRILLRDDRARLDLRSIAVRNFSGSLIVLMAGVAVQLSTAVALPIYLQNSLLFHHSHWLSLTPMLTLSLSELPSEFYGQRL